MWYGKGVPKRPETLGHRLAPFTGQGDRARYHAAYDRERKRVGSPTALLEELRHCARWYRLRRMVLAREPLCRTCQAAGRVTAAAQVDHIVRAIDVIRERGPDAFYDAANLQPLCVPCHAAKGATERAGL